MMVVVITYTCSIASKTFDIPTATSITLITTTTITVAFVISIAISTMLRWMAVTAFSAN